MVSPFLCIAILPFCRHLTLIRLTRHLSLVDKIALEVQKYKFRGAGQVSMLFLQRGIIYRNRTSRVQWLKAQKAGLFLLSYQ